MIWFVYGIPRTGKSLFGGIVDGILPSIKDGRHVYTNIPGLSKTSISELTGQTVFKVNELLHPIDKIGDILKAFDYQNNRVKQGYAGSMWIIDEFRALNGLNTKTETLLSIFLNSSAKEIVDFIFIAQLPSYFDSEIRNLGEGCTVYERGDSMGRKNHSIEWKFDRNQGTPYKVGKRWDTENWKYRYRDPKYFRCYSSYPDAAFLIKMGGETHRTIGFWQRKTFKISIFIIFVVLCIFGLLIYLFSSTKSTLDNLGSVSENKQVQSSTEEIRTNIIHNNSGTEPFFQDFQDNHNCFKSMFYMNGRLIYQMLDGTTISNPSQPLLQCSKQSQQ